MQFQYTAKSLNGQSAAGVLDAPSLTQARQQLHQSGLFPISIAPAESANVAGATPGMPGRRKRIRKTDLLMATSQLSIMCRSGIDLAEALRSVSRECRNPALRDVFSQIYQDVSQGSSASVAFRRHRHIFGDAYVASIDAAEASGAVNDVLPRLVDMLRNEIRLQSSLKSVAAYPVVLLGVAAVVLTVLVFFVLPQFSHVFESLGRPAPPLTALLLDVAQLLRQNVLWLILGASGTAVALTHLLRTESARRYWDEATLNGPIIRNGSRALLTGRSFRTLGLMLASGVPLIDAVRLCRSAVRNRVFQGLFQDLEHDVLNGKGIGPTVSRAEFIPPGAAQMVSTAEQTGKLAEVMQLVGEFYEEEGERLVRSTVKLLEPAIIIVMGVIVTGVVLAVVLPLLDVSTIPR